MFDIERLRTQIETLVRDNPALHDDEVLRADMLEGATDLHEVLTCLCRAMDADRFLVEGINARLGQLVERKKRLLHRVEMVRDLILQAMQSANLKKLELPEVTLLQRNQPPQIVGAIDVDKLPDGLCRITREANRTAIREALLNHRELPGLSLSNSPPGLTIKAK
jgi:hypothetical protein